MPLDIQEKFRIAIHTNDTARIERLAKLEAPSFETVKYAIDKAKKFSCVRTRQTLILVMDQAQLTDSEKYQIKNIIVWGMGSQVTALLEKYV